MRSAVMANIFRCNTPKLRSAPSLCLLHRRPPHEDCVFPPTAKATMTSSGPDTKPDWLKSLIRDRGPGPRLYQWTLNDVKGHDKVNTTANEPREVNSPAAARRRIYILGLGNLGRLFAVGLAKLPNAPPVTLVVHRKSLLEYWRNRPGVILHPQGFLRHSVSSEESKFTGFDVELWSEEPPPQPQAAIEIGQQNASPKGGPLPNSHRIYNLIIATKAQDAMRQADWIRRYLGPESTVIFAQNGMNKLWPPYGPVYNEARYPEPHEPTADTAAQHPQWMAAVVTHGVTSVGPFESIHASPAGVVLGAVTSGKGASGQSPTDSFMAKQVLASPLLNTRLSSTPELLVVQLEKLVVNSVINSLTAILRCKNGGLFVTLNENGSAEERKEIVSRVMDRLLEESSTVLQSMVKYDNSSHDILHQPLGENGTANNSDSADAYLQRLSFAGLRSMLYRVAALVADNRSSMLQDVEAGKSTEVREFNGWFVEMAAYLKTLGVEETKSIDVTAHRTLLELVESKQILDRADLKNYFPHI